MPVHLQIPFHRKAKASSGRASSSLDMTEGEPFKIIFRYSLPVLIGNLVQQLYNMADMIIVGRFLGTDALAAVGNTGAMNFLVLGFANGLTSGFAVITAQRYGAKDDDGVRRSVAANIVLNAIFSVSMLILAVLTAAPILKAINTPEPIFRDSWVYITIIYIGIPATVLYNFAACILRAVGDSRSPLYFLITAALINVGLDILFIAQVGMGVAGAALATILAQVLAGAASTVFMFVRYSVLRTHKPHFRLSLNFMGRHLKIGLPMAFQFSITAIGVVILQGALNVFGPEKIAGYSAANKIENLISIAAGAFGVTMANYTGQNYGAGRLDRVKEGTKKCCIITLGFSILSMMIAIFFSDALTTLFVESSETGVIEASRQYLRISSLFYPALFLIFVFRNTLQSLGRGFMPVMAGVAELVARAVAAFILPTFFGYLGICFVGATAWVCAAALLAISYAVIIRGY